MSRPQPTRDTPTSAVLLIPALGVAVDQLRDRHARSGQPAVVDGAMAMNTGRFGRTLRSGQSLGRRAQPVGARRRAARTRHNGSVGEPVAVQPDAYRRHPRARRRRSTPTSAPGDDSSRTGTGRRGLSQHALTRRSVRPCPSSHRVAAARPRSHRIPLADDRRVSTIDNRRNVPAGRPGGPHPS